MLGKNLSEKGVWGLFTGSDTSLVDESRRRVIDQLLIVFINFFLEPYLK